MVAAGVELYLTTARATDMTRNVAVRCGERLSALLLLVALCALQFTASNAVAQDQDTPQHYAFEISELNEGLVDAEMTPRLDTPRAALESFLSAIDADDPTSAAHVLNMNAIPAEEQAQRAPDLAMMLAYVLHRHDLISWRDIPDTPDARVLPDMQSSVGPYSRRSIELGEIMLDARPVSISLHRYSVDGEEPKWLFSPTAVERIPQLYGAIRQGWLGDWVSLRQRCEPACKSGSDAYLVHDSRRDSTFRHPLLEVVDDVESKATGFPP